MKFPPFPKKEKKPDPVKAAPKVSPKASSAISMPRPDRGRRQIMVGLMFISIAFLGTVFLLYLTVNAQSAKETELQELNDQLLLLSTENEIAQSKSQALQQEVGRVIDLDKVVDASQKIHDETEADRKQGSMWINRKTQKSMVTLGVLNGVSAGSRLGVYEGDQKIGIVKVTSALDVVSYVEPIDKKLNDFTKNYYAIKFE